MPRDASIRLTGRVLFLTQDPELLARQLAGEDLAYDPSIALIDNISTDEITPGWVCFHYDEKLGEYALVGLRGGVISQRAIKDGGFEVIVSGKSKGCGSSREQAPFAELAAGVKLVIAESIEKIYGQNCQNIGLFTSTDFGLIERIRRGEAIPLDTFTRGLDSISTEIVNAGGLFAYNQARMSGAISPESVQTPVRPMTMVEKIVAAHAVRDAKSGELGVPSVQPGDALFVRTDVRFSHEYVTPMAESLFRGALGPDARVNEPESVYTFRDHLTFLGDVMAEDKKRQGLLERANALATTQESFAKKQRLKHYGETARGGSMAICHNAVIEDLALPGQIVTGTDSHTCMAGALGCFAYGVGSTDMANAWYTRDVRVRVPESVLFRLRGALRPGVCAKDVMLHILSQPFFRTSKGIGKVLEFAGPAIATLPLDERATLTNMAVEAGGFTGIIEADEVVVEYLASMRPGLSKEDVRARIVKSDPDAHYLEAFDIDLADVPVMVATPGDPRNGKPVSAVEQEVRIDIAYGGSCTGGKKSDMDMYASVLRRAVAEGMHVPEGVSAYIQFGSQHIRDYAEKQGYLELFQRAGVTLIEPSCGACINAGPGASQRADQVTVSAINRNFPGRSGPGQVYLASPLTVAAERDRRQTDVTRAAFHGLDEGRDRLYIRPMTKIAPGKFVILDYVLADEDGDVIQRSADEEVGPLTYVHGYSPILPGLHKGLEGLGEGDHTSVRVPPEEGYGLADEEAIFEVERSELPNPEGVKFGDEIVAEDDDGNEFAMHVVEVHDDSVVVDTNHPLAGYTLVWDVTVREVRDASQIEIDRARADAAELDVSPDGTD